MKILSLLWASDDGTDGGLKVYLVPDDFELAPADDWIEQEQGPLPFLPAFGIGQPPPGPRDPLANLRPAVIDVPSVPK